ncbi:hypothetical protein Tco_0035240, partial [Tanacetum coccineum]
IPSPPLPPILSPLPVSPPLPHIPSPPLPVSSPVLVLYPSPPASPIRLLGYRAAMIRLRAETSSISHPLPLPTSSPPLQLLSSDHMTDRPEITLPPRKRLGINLGPRYDIRKSSAAAATRPVRGRRADYGFVDTMDTEIRRRRAEEVGYRPETLGGVNTRVTKLTAVQEQDTQDIYAVIEDTQDRQTHIYQSVRTLVDDSQYHYETARLLEILELRSVEMGQQAVISQLQTTDRKSQTQMAEFQRQLGPAKGLAQPDAPGEAGSSS